MRRKWLAAILCYTCSISLAQQVSIEPTSPPGASVLRPYRAPEVPEIRVANSGRLRDLIRAGTLYLTAQDAIALALENNIGIEGARYNPILSVGHVGPGHPARAFPYVHRVA